MRESIEEFVSRRNLALLRRQLGVATNVAQRKILLVLLAEEAAKPKKAEFRYG